MAATKIPINILPISSSAQDTFISSKTFAPIMAGIERRKEDLKISLLSTPLNNPVVIVNPLLEIPGNIEIARWFEFNPGYESNLTGADFRSAPYS